MVQKKTLRPEDITEKDILSFYDAILPLLYRNPAKLDPVIEFKNGIRKFVEFDSFHYMMEDPVPPLPDEKFSATFERYGDRSGTEQDLKVMPLENMNTNESFAIIIERSKEKMIESARKNDPEKVHWHYHRIISSEYPQVMVGFFRFGKTKEDNAFTKNDILIFEKLAPHVQILLPTILTPQFNSPNYKHFDLYIDICSRIARDHRLSDTEVKFLPDILFGRTNEEMAEKYFISLATVKKHIQHIFKKTGCRNRIDFISKFFTSPDHIAL